ncbi:MAG: YjbQ family protein [Desulfobacterales bacterium]|nr:YjbQ family protein [Desulfobacterales bacterium]
MQLTVKTHAQTEMIDLTAQIQKLLSEHGVQEGICMLYVPHTTAAVTINESADPSVREDILMVLNQMVPWKAAYRHAEGNSPAHVKASLMGASQLVRIENGRLALGTWQGIFFCEFDGPRTRKMDVALIAK